MSSPIKILAMDGGNGINTATLLQRLETATQRSFLNQTDIFVGTSAGGINSLFFAAASNPTEALADIQKFWLDVNLSILGGQVTPEAIQAAAQSTEPAPSNPTSPLAGGQEATGTGKDVIQDILGLGCAAAGFRSLFLNDEMKHFLIRHFGATTTLKDLNKPVILVSFKLDNGKPGIRRSWEARLFTNLPYRPKGINDLVSDPDEQDHKVVDVALRTSAAPLELPIYQSMDGKGAGYVDGGLVANNPAMIALSAIVGTLAQGGGGIEPVPPTESLRDINLLSVGTGRNLVGTAQYLQPEFTNGSAPWGYRQWLFDPSNLLVLVNSWLQAGNEAVSWQCERLLGEKNFHRLNVPLKNMIVEDNPETNALVMEASAWLKRGAWFEQPTTVTAVTRAMSLRSKLRDGEREARLRAARHTGRTWRSV